MVIYKVDGPYSVGPDADPQSAYESIHSHDTGIKDTLKDITNCGGILDIILECGRLEICVDMYMQHHIF